MTLHPPIVSDLQVQTALEEEKEEDTPLDRIVSGFFFFGSGDYWKYRSRSLVIRKL